MADCGRGRDGKRIYNVKIVDFSELWYFVSNRPVQLLYIKFILKHYIEI
jgi:hypothetical protein